MFSDKIFGIFNLAYMLFISNNYKSQPKLMEGLV